MNDSGQGFSVFRLLISAIMALMILLIILGVYRYFDDMRLNLGYQRIVDGFNNAANKPDGTVITVQQAELRSGTQISSVSLSQGTSVKKECIRITGAESEAVTIDSGEKLATINHYTNLKAYIKCETNMEECEIYCTVSVNKKIE